MFSCNSFHSWEKTPSFFPTDVCEQLYQVHPLGLTSWQLWFWHNYHIALVDCFAMSITHFASLVLLPDRSYIPLSPWQGHATMDVPAKACWEEEIDALKGEKLQAALLISWICICWCQEVLVPERQGWGEQEGPYESCSWTQKCGMWDMETLFWGRHNIHLLNRPIIQQLTSSQRQNPWYCEKWLRLTQPWLPYVCVPVGKTISARCASTEDLWNQGWRSQGCSPPSPQLQAAVQESADVC